MKLRVAYHESWEALDITMVTLGGTLLPNDLPAPDYFILNFAEQYRAAVEAVIRNYGMLILPNDERNKLEPPRSGPHYTSIGCYADSTGGLRFRAECTCGWRMEQGTIARPLALDAAAGHRRVNAS